MPPAWISPSNLGRLLVTITATFLLCGCGASSGSRASTAVVPGGANVAPKSAAPQICKDLAGSFDVRALGAAIASWASNGADRGAATRMRAGGKAIQSLASRAPRALAHDLRSIASTVEHQADRGGNPVAVGLVATSMQRLGELLERPCGYHLG